MTGLFLPPSVSRSLMDERARQAADVVEMTVRTMHEFNRELREIDPLLELVKAREDLDVATASFKPGYWHIIRKNVGAPVSVIPVEGPNGEYVEPGSNVFDVLARSDMWSSVAVRRREKREEQAKISAERRREREREDRQQELLERYLAATRAQVSMNTGAAWSQNVAGRRGATR